MTDDPSTMSGTRYDPAAELEAQNAQLRARLAELEADRDRLREHLQHAHAALYGTAGAVNGYLARWETEAGDAASAGVEGSAPPRR